MYSRSSCSSFLEQCHRARLAQTDSPTSDVDRNGFTPKQPGSSTQTAGPSSALNESALRQTNAAAVPLPSGGTVLRNDCTPACVYCSRSSSLPFTSNKNQGIGCASLNPKYITMIRFPVYAVNAAAICFTTNHTKHTKKGTILRSRYRFR